MDRKEFCKLLVKARKKSGVRTMEMCSISGLNRDTINRIEKGINNFGLEKILKYLEATKHTVKLQSQNSDKYLMIQCYSDFLGILKEIKKKYTERELATLIDGSDTVIGAIIRKTHSASVDTFLKLMEAMKYTIELEMSDTAIRTVPTYVEIPKFIYESNIEHILPTYTKIPKSIFESNIEHAALTNTKKIFSELTETPEWYKKNPYLYRQKAQHIKNKFHNNQLTLDKMTDILVNSGYIYRLKIFSPDRGTSFLEYADAYELMSKIYNVCDVLEIQSLSPYTIKDGDTRRLSIDIMLQFLIKIGCDVSIQWELVEIVNV